ncbi:MAG: hypothetical protein RXQ94_05180 [Caldivirga sp.]
MSQSQNSQGGVKEAGHGGGRRRLRGRGVRLVHSEDFGEWTCPKVWVVVGVCGPSIFFRDQGLNVHGGKIPRVVKFTLQRDKQSGKVVELRLAISKSLGRVVVTAAASGSKPTGEYLIPDDEGDLMKFLSGVLERHLGIKITEDNSDHFRFEVEPILNAFKRLTAALPFIDFFERKVRKLKPLRSLSGIDELREYSLINRVARKCINKLYRKNTWICHEYLYIVPRGDVIELFNVKVYLDGSVSKQSIATLPSRLAIVHDPITGGDYLVAFVDGKLVKSPLAFDPGNPAKLLEPILVKPGLNVTGDEVFVTAMLLDYLTRTRYFEVALTPGLWPGFGFVDPFGAIDVNNYGPRALVDIVKWIDRHYKANSIEAKANVAYAIAKLITPAIKRKKTQFVDPVIINMSQGGLGVSTLTREIIAKIILGIDPGDERYMLVLSGSVRSEPQFRNLVAHNGLPLILDEQKAGDLANNRHIIHSAAVGENIVGVHAATYGEGFGAVFRSRRGVIINTNVTDRNKILSILAVDESPYTYVRRIRFIPWRGGADALLNGAAAYADLPDTKPLIGYLANLFNAHWEELMKPGTFDELTHVTLELIKRDAANDPEVVKAVEELEEAVRAIEEREAEEKSGYFTSGNDVMTLINGLKELARANRRQTDLPNLLLTLLEAGVQDGVAFTRDTRVSMGDVKAGIEDALRIVGVIRDATDTGAASLDAVANEPGAWGEFAKRIIGMLNNGVVRIAFINGSALIGGRRDTFMGKKPSKLRSLGGKEAFSFTLDEIINAIINASVIEGGEDGGEGGVDSGQTG